MDLDFDKIKELIDKGYIYKNTHPSGELFIYNYTDKTQYDNFWTPETLQCRGLICNHKNEIIARPFSKFFNLHDLPTIPTESYELYEKLDGSLGILYFYDDKPYIATRGHFTSPQALEAQEMLYSLYKDSIPVLNKKFTYLFEIIYPSNRVIVNYGDTRSLTLLGVIDTQTAKEFSVEQFSKLGFPIVQKILTGGSRLEGLRESNEPNKEGYVIKFANGERAKIKFLEYVKLHSFISSISKKKIWELLKDQISFDDLLQKVPDEFYKWIRKTVKDIKGEYLAIEEDCKAELSNILSKVTDRNNRKELASHITIYKYPSILFPMLDNKDYSKYIWKIIEPVHEVPVFTEIKAETG